MKFSCLERKQLFSSTKAFVTTFSCSFNRPSSSWSTGDMKLFRGNHAYRVATTRRQRVRPTMEHDSSHEGQHSGGRAEHESEERLFNYRFDPQSDTDAFGRDPRKETEFWMDAAKHVLESDAVQQAIIDHAAAGGDGLTDEQREYLDFIKSLDEESK